MVNIKFQTAEAKLVRLLKTKNKQAFVVLYDLYSAALFGTISKLVKDNTLATEVLKKTFERIWWQTEKLNYTNTTFFMWMHNIARDVAIEELNKAMQEGVQRQRLKRNSGYARSAFISN